MGVASRMHYVGVTPSLAAQPFAFHAAVGPILTLRLRELFDAALIRCSARRDQRYGGNGASDADSLQLGNVLS